MKPTLRNALNAAKTNPMKPFAPFAPKDASNLIWVNG